MFIRGPQGQRRPGNVIFTAVEVVKTAAGKIENHKKNGKVSSGKSRRYGSAQSFTKEQPAEIATKAAKERWGS